MQSAATATVGVTTIRVCGCKRQRDPSACEPRGELIRRAEHLDISALEIFGDGGPEDDMRGCYALADRTGAKMLVAEGAGEYSTYDLAAGMAKLGRHLVWLLLGADAYAVDEQLGPSCDPDDHR